MDSKDTTEDIVSNNSGNKFDSGKARFELIPPDVLFDLADLYSKGAIKYGDRNWEKGIPLSRLFGALMRHAWLFWKGEDFDTETKSNHMTAVAWNALAILHFFKTRPELDDRSKNIV